MRMFWGDRKDPTTGKKVWGWGQNDPAIVLRDDGFVMTAFARHGTWSATAFARPRTQLKDPDAYNAAWIGPKDGSVAERIVGWRLADVVSAGVNVRKGEHLQWDEEGEPVLGGSSIVGIKMEYLRSRWIVKDSLGNEWVLPGTRYWFVWSIIKGEHGPRHGMVTETPGWKMTRDRWGVDVLGGAKGPVPAKPRVLKAVRCEEHRRREWLSKLAGIAVSHRKETLAAMKGA